MPQSGALATPVVGVFGGTLNYVCADIDTLVGDLPVLCGDFALGVEVGDKYLGSLAYDSATLTVVLNADRASATASCLAVTLGGNPAYCLECDRRSRQRPDTPILRGHRGFEQRTLCPSR